MGNKSFYDLDYIIEINEQRLEQYSNTYQKNIDRFTSLLVVYSAMCIFLVPIMQTLFITQEQYHWSYYCSFYLFSIFFTVSVINAVLLLLPEGLDILRNPSTYYSTFKRLYEAMGLPFQQIDDLIKASYIEDLQFAITKKHVDLLRKISFYERAFYFAIMAFIPYLYCVWLQISFEKKDTLKKESVSKLISFTKTNHLYHYVVEEKTKIQRDQ